MKIVSLVARNLLGLIFFVFGLNGFLHFIPLPMPSGAAGEFMQALFVSHYMVAVSLFEVAAGALLLLNRYVPLALALLGPLIVNILLYHALMDPSGLPLAVVVTLLWIVTALNVRTVFVGFLQPRAEY